MDCEWTSDVHPSFTPRRAAINGLRIGGEHQNIGDAIVQRPILLAFGTVRFPLP
jgi:hypothetical protein